MLAFVRGVSGGRAPEAQEQRPHRYVPLRVVGPRRVEALVAGGDDGQDGFGTAPRLEGLGEGVEEEPVVAVAVAEEHEDALVLPQGLVLGVDLPHGRQRL